MDHLDTTLNHAEQAAARGAISQDELALLREVFAIIKEENGNDNED